MLSRRDFHRLALAAVPASVAAAKPNSKINGVQLGAQSYSFRDRSLDEAIKGMLEVGLSECELWQGHIEPKGGGREALTKWRTTVSMDVFKDVRKNFEDAMKGSSKYIGINLDIGHFTAAGFDAVDYLKKQHEHIVTLHIKDRKKDQGETHGANLPLGKGETPIKEVLKLLKENQWAIPANIEYEYKGADTVAEVKSCYEYCKSALA